MYVPLTNGGSGRARLALEWLDTLPWASAWDLSRCCGRSLPASYRVLASLERSGRVGRFGVSTGGKSWQRFVLADDVSPGVLRRHQPDVVRWCRGNLELMEGTYRLLGDLVAAGRGRRLEEFRWEPGSLCGGAARFDDGWCVVLWSGRGESLIPLRVRLARVSERGFPGGARPGWFFLVVPDLFQADLALRAAEEAGIGSVVSAVLSCDGMVVGPELDLSGSIGWYGSVRRPVEVADVPEALGPGGVWTGGGARRRLRVLGGAEQWPGADGRLLLRLSGCGRRGFGVELGRLLSGGLLERLPRGGFGCGLAWRSYAARRDRVGEAGLEGPLVGRWRRGWARWLREALDRGWIVVPGHRAAGWFERGTPDVVLGRWDGPAAEWRGVWGLGEARDLADGGPW